MIRALAGLSLGAALGGCPPAETTTVGTSPANRYDQCVRYAVEIWCPLRLVTPDRPPLPVH